jgi:transcriptional regulator with GAF, ATPase, and Fis domain
MSRPTKTAQIERQREICAELKTRIANCRTVVGPWGGKVSGESLAAHWTAAYEVAKAELDRLTYVAPARVEPIRLRAPDGSDFQALTAQFQAELIANTLAAYGMDTTKAGKALGLSPKQLAAQIKRFSV